MLFWTGFETTDMKASPDKLAEITSRSGLPTTRYTAFLCALDTQSNSPHFTLFSSRAPRLVFVSLCPYFINILLLQACLDGVNRLH